MWTHNVGVNKSILHNKVNDGAKTLKKNIGLLISTVNSGCAERVVSHLSNILSETYHVHVILFEDTHIECECGGVPAQQIAAAK